MDHRTGRTGHRPLWTVCAFVVTTLWMLPVVAFGQEPGATAAPEVVDPQLAQGAEVYSRFCQACHQPGGVGLTGQFPPLLDNPNVTDAAYVEDVIRNGRSGAIEVAGVTYDGQMPAQSTLPADEVAAVVAYVVAGFPPVAPAPAAGSGLPVAGTTLPELSTMAYLAAAALVAGAGLFVLGPRLVGVVDRLQVPWLDAWLRTAVIVVFFFFATVWLPSRILQTGPIAKLPQMAQDVIGSGLWLAGLGVGLWALWYAQRSRRI